MNGGNVNEKSFEKLEKGFDFAQAVVEANRCLLCYDAPCSKGCPGGTDPGTFIRKLKLRNVTGAIRTIKNNNVFGLACGILCPTSRLCEMECSATSIDRPIQIGRIQRFLMEHAEDIKFHPAVDAEKREGRVAVVGSGPAGMTCAAELAKLGHQVSVFESRPEPGGVLRYGVPEYRFPVEYLRKELKYIESLGVEFKCNTHISGKKAVEDLLMQGYEAVFVATGLWNSVRLNNKNTDGIFASTDFLARMKEGRAEELKKSIAGKKVAVIGGGSVAVDCVETSARLDAQDVYLVYRRSFLQMPAEEDERLDMLNAGAHMLLLNQPVDYIEENGKLTGIRLRRTELGPADEAGRKKPVEIPGSDWTLKIDIVIEAIGSAAEAGSPEYYPSVAVDSSNLIKADPETGATSAEGIFAGGDIVSGPALIITAVRDGKKAAAAIHEYIIKKK